jgi:hypothetical protein
MNYLNTLMFLLPRAKWKFPNNPIPEGGWTYEDLIWEDLFYPKPTKEELEIVYKYASLSATDDYRMKRQSHYPSAEEQLAIIFDKGIDGWKEYIQNVKDNIPKPNID